VKASPFYTQPHPNFLRALLSSLVTSSSTPHSTTFFAQYYTVKDGKIFLKIDIIFSKNSAVLGTILTLSYRFERDKYVHTHQLGQR
jgi:hypothetical protein